METIVLIIFSIVEAPASKVSSTSKVATGLVTHVHPSITVGRVTISTRYIPISHVHGFFFIIVILLDDLDIIFQQK
jgi:hypothetical protein